MKSLVYVKKYKSNPNAPVEPTNGRTYIADDDGDFWNLKIDEVASFTIHKKLCTQVTPENVSTITFHPEDERLVTSYMSDALGIATAVREVKEEDNIRAEVLSQSLGMIVALDPMMGDALADLLSYIASTYGDKYEEAFPLVDIYNLKYSGGMVSSGFNVGNSLKYLKRYMTQGFDKSYNPQDIKKGIQFLLFELVNRQDGENKA